MQVLIVSNLCFDSIKRLLVLFESNGVSNDRKTKKMLFDSISFGHVAKNR